MKISIKKLLKKQKARVAVIHATGIVNKGKDTRVYKLIEEVSQLMQLEFTPDSIANHNLIAPWKVIYEEYGKKPTKYKTNVEELMKQALKGKVPNKTKLANICNYISLKHIIPVSCYGDKVDIEHFGIHDVSASSENVIIVIHGLYPVTNIELKKAMGDALELLATYLIPEELKFAILNEKTPEVII